MHYNVIVSVITVFSIELSAVYYRSERSHWCWWITVHCHGVV